MTCLHWHMRDLENTTKNVSSVVWSIQNLFPQELEFLIASVAQEKFGYVSSFTRKNALLECHSGPVKLSIVQSEVGDWVGDIFIEEFTIKVDVQCCDTLQVQHIQAKIESSGMICDHLNVGNKVALFLTIDLSKGWTGTELRTYIAKFFEFILCRDKAAAA